MEGLDVGLDIGTKGKGEVSRWCQLSGHMLHRRNHERVGF